MTAHIPWQYSTTPQTQEALPKRLLRQHPPKMQINQKTTERKTRTVLPRAANKMTQAAKEVKPTFLSGYILGSPNWTVELPAHTAIRGPQLGRKLSFLDTKRDPKAMSALGREQVDTRGTRKQIHKSRFKHWILTRTFGLPIWKERTTWKFPFFSQPGITDRDLGQLTLIRILTVCCLLPVSPEFCTLQSEWGVPVGSS